MFAKNPLIRVASSLPVLLIITVFSFEWYCFNIIFVYEGLARWEGESENTAIVRTTLFNAAWLLAMWSYLRVSFSDPGFVGIEWSRMRVSTKDSHPVYHHYNWNPGCHSTCRHCSFKRPERTHHCRVCGQCVLRMDHHCPWVGNCVGFKNHKYFILMLGYTALACFIFAISGWPMLRTLFFSSSGAHTVGEITFSGYSLLGIAIVIAAAFGVSVSAMFIAHIFMMLINRTSIEVSYAGRNPYSLGLCHNAQQLLGAVGLEWFLPISSLEPQTDGFSFPTDCQECSPSLYPPV